MAAVTWADVVALAPAPELAEVEVAAQDHILAYVHEVLSVSLLGGEESARLRRARVLLAAHMATMTGGEGGAVIAGPVLSESTGSISRSYANLIGAAGRDFSGSSYGDEYVRLVRHSAARLPRVF